MGVAGGGRAVRARGCGSTWAAIEVHGESVNPLAATYLNRLSDLLFILARTMASRLVV
jgi:cob(I)alamin adenosyltransferase